MSTCSICIYNSALCICGYSSIIVKQTLCGFDGTMVCCCFDPNLGVSHSLPVSLWGSFRFSCFLRLPKNMPVWWTGYANLPLGVNMYVHGLQTSLYFCLTPSVPWIGSGSAVTLTRIDWLLEDERIKLKQRHSKINTNKVHRFAFYECLNRASDCNPVSNTQKKI